MEPILISDQPSVLYGILDSTKGHHMMPSTDGYWELNMTNSTGSDALIRINWGRGPGSGVYASGPLVNVHFDYFKAGVFTTISASGVQSGYTDVAFPTGESCTSFRIRVYANTNERVTVDSVTIGVTGLTAGPTIPSKAYGHLVGLDYPELLQLDSTSDLRCTAMAVLVSYMGSELDNGGLIAQARLPRGFSLFEVSSTTDYVTAFAALTRENHDNALKHGAYCWWMPMEAQDKDFVHSARTRSFHDETTLWFSMVRDSPSQTVRVRATQIVEFLTSNPTYTIRPPGWDPDLPLVLRHLQTHLPAATENDLHDRLKAQVWRALNKVKGVLRDPSTYARAAEVLVPLLLG
jgi:hypothetical protein